jgi:hypothetical protein
MDDCVVTTLVLVTPSARAEGDEDRFTPGHLRELSERFDQVVMVLDQESGDPGDPASLSSDRVARTEAPLESVLASLAANGDDAQRPAVIIDGDIDTARHAGSVARQHSVPALWWCDGPPSGELQRDTVDFVDAVLAPGLRSAISRHLAIGAGIDMRDLRALPLPPRPPLRCLVLGREVGQGGFAVSLRALAEARARGSDVHFLIVDSVRVSSQKARRLTEALVADLALSRSVELLDTDDPLSLPDIVQTVHAVVDVGGDTEVDHSVLRAMACSRAVISARPMLAPLLADERLPLVFATGDASSLASCMSALADARHDELTDLGARLRARVEHQHSLPRWGVSIAAVVEALQNR